MEIISARNPKRTKVGGIDLLVNFKDIGEVPFHAMPSDPMVYGRELFDRAETGEFGAIQPYVEPPAVVVVPFSVTKRQGKLALLGAGLLDDVEAAIAAIADPTLRRMAEIDFADAMDWQREWPLLNQMATQMGITQEQLDALFIQAATL